MLFPSREFLFYFLPLLVAVYYLLPRRHRLAFLTAGSYFFYGWWDPRFVGLLLFSTVANYLLAATLHRREDVKTRKTILVLAVILNLTLLGFFKYFMFLNHSLAAVGGWAGVAYPRPLLDLKIVLPIGISFFTFHCLSYLVDVYRRDIRPADSLLDFACYIALFPHLIAGPIVRFSQIAAQLKAPAVSLPRFNLGLQFFILGLAKKVLLADNLSPLCAKVFDAPDLAAFTSLDVLAATVAYTLQIYFDFSGYSDMAVGLAYFLGFEFPKNFNSPYRSVSISEFWRRWHMTLSFWLRDYLYIPLGGSRRGKIRNYANLILTMLLGGLWHGANWTFVVWGAWHGLWLAVERALGERNPLRRLPRPVQIVWTFFLAGLGWIVFRASSLARAAELLRKLFVFDLRAPALGGGADRLPLALIVVGLAIVFGLRNTWQIGTEARGWKTAGLAALFLLSLVFLLGSVSHPFLYFQF